MRTLKLVAIVLLFSASARDAAAQAAVYDPPAWLQRYIRYVEQAVEHKQKMDAYYAQWQRLKNLPQRYRAKYEPSWRHLTQTDAYELAKEWGYALDAGDHRTITKAQEAVAYANAIYRLSAAGRKKFGNSQKDVQNAAVHVDLVDNAVRDAVRSVGIYRAETGQLDQQLVELYKDLLGPDQERDGLLQKSALATAIAAHQQRYTNRLLSAFVEQQALENQGERDAQARGLEAAVYGQEAAPGLWRFAQSQDIRSNPY